MDVVEIEEGVQVKVYEGDSKADISEAQPSVQLAGAPSVFSLASS